MHLIHHKYDMQPVAEIMRRIAEPQTFHTLDPLIHELHEIHEKLHNMPVSDGMNS